MNVDNRNLEPVPLTDPADQPNPVLPPRIPRIVVDPWGMALRDPVSGAVVGRAGFPDAGLGRGRVVAALPLDDGPRLLAPARLVVDPWGFTLRDPVSGNVVGNAPVIVQRLLSAGLSQDTRRL